MTLNSPFIISSRLAPAVQIGNSTVSLIERTNGDDHRVRCHFAIDTPDFEHIDDQMQTGNVRSPSIESMFENFLGFLGSASESYMWQQRTGRVDDDGNSKLFPPHVVEWAVENANEISSLCWELQEADKPLIVEE